MAQRFIVKTEIGGAFFFWLLKTQRAGADSYACAVSEFMLELLFTVYINFICAALELSVDQHPVDDFKSAVVAYFNMRVMARRARVIQHDLVIGCAPNQTGLLRIQLMLRLAATGIGDFQ